MYSRGYNQWDPTACALVPVVDLANHKTMALPLTPEGLMDEGPLRLMIARTGLVFVNGGIVLLDFGAGAEKTTTATEKSDGEHNHDSGVRDGGGGGTYRVAKVRLWAEAQGILKNAFAGTTANFRPVGCRGTVWVCCRHGMSRTEPSTSTTTLPGRSTHRATTTCS